MWPISHRAAAAIITLYKCTNLPSASVTERALTLNVYVTEHGCRLQKKVGEFVLPGQRFQYHWTLCLPNDIEVCRYIKFKFM